MCAEKTKRLYVPELDALRGLMAWWVVAGHVYSYFYVGAKNFPGLPQRFLLATAIPVNIFICLSGFVIGGGIIASSQLYRNYLTRRAFRIFPVYLVVMAASILLLDARMEARTLAPWLTQEQIFGAGEYFHGVEANLKTHLALCFVLLQGILPDQLLPHSGDAFLAPAWSRSLEWQFYLFAPLIVLLVMRSRIYCLTILFVSAAAAFLVFKYKLTFSFGAFLIPRLSFFVLGIVSFHVVFFSSKSDMGAKKSYLIIFPAIVLLQLLTHENNATVASTILWELGVLFVLYRTKYSTIQACVEIVRSFLGSRALQAVGAISYPTYLVHVLVIDLIGLYLLRMGLNPTIGWASSLALWASIFFATIAVSAALHFSVEGPGISLGRMLTAKRKDLAMSPSQFNP